MNFAPCRANEKSHTGLIGYLDVSYSDLERVFGQPHINGSPDGKTKAEWDIEFEDGTVATIYDYKSGCDPAENSCWHVGGFKKVAIGRVTELLREFGVQFDEF